jgi:hypothetical protein
VRVSLQFKYSSAVPVLGMSVSCEVIAQVEEEGCWTWVSTWVWWVIYLRT